MRGAIMRIPNQAIVWITWLALNACHPTDSDPARRAPMGSSPSSALTTASPSPPASTPAHPCPAEVHAVRIEGTVDIGATVVSGSLDGTTFVWVADADEHAVHTFDIDGAAPTSRIQMGGAPSALLLRPSGRLYATLSDTSELAVLEVQPHGEIVEVCRVGLPAEPVGLAVTPDGGQLLATSRWGHKVSGFALPHVHRQFERELARDPFAVAASSDGKRAIVTHVVNGQISVIELQGPGAHVVDVARSRTAISLSSRGLHPRPAPHIPTGGVKYNNDTAIEVPLVHGEGYGYALTRVAAGDLVAPWVLVATRTSDDETPYEAFLIGYGTWLDWPARHASIRIASATGDVQVPRPTKRGNFPRTDCLLPRASAYDAEAERLLTLCMGRRELIAEDVIATWRGVEEAGTKSAELRARDVDPIRIPLAAGSTGLAWDGKNRRALVWSQFDSVLEVIQLSVAAARSTTALRAAPGYVAPAIVRIPIQRKRRVPELVDIGRRVFHSTNDERISWDGRACATCHPGGRDDGAVWATWDGPRQTPMLIGRLADTAPYGWWGDMGSLRAQLAKTAQNLRAPGSLSKREADGLIAYLLSLEVPASWQPTAAESVGRGQALFSAAKLGCETCHRGGDGTDGIAHDIGSADRVSQAPDTRKRFDTPSLRFVSHSPPYFHDGRYQTLRALLADTQHGMGDTASLEPADFEALLAYLESL